MDDFNVSEEKLDVGGVEDGGAEFASLQGLSRQSGGGDNFAMRLLQSNGNVDELRTLSILRENEWREYDDAVTMLARGNFSLVSDMFSNGMRKTIPNIMGITQLSWDRVGGMDDAQIDMTAEATDILDKLEFGQDSMPVPLIHKGFRLNIRNLMASRRNGTGLDVRYAEEATRKVVHTVEKLFLYGNFSAGVGAGRVYGMTTYPYRATGALRGDWRSATATNIFLDVNDMVEALEAKYQFGPYMLYIPRSYAPVLRKDYDRTTSLGSSVLKRLMEIEGLKGIRTNIFLPDNHVVLLNLSSNTAEAIDGIQPRIIEWNSNGGMSTMFKVIACILPRIRRDADNNCGVAHFTV
jgi:uncharacterized linocin/CFP29 family protein